MTRIGVYDNDRSLHEFALVGDSLRWRLPGQPKNSDIFFYVDEFVTSLRMLDSSYPRMSVGPTGPYGLRREGTFIGIQKPTGSRLYWFGPTARGQLDSLLRRTVRKVVSV